MNEPDSNPYAPPNAELREFAAAPHGCVRVGSLFVVKKGSEQNVPADTCVCCGEPSLKAKVRTYTRRPDWLGIVLFCGLVSAAFAPMPWSLILFIAVVICALYGGIALAQKTTVQFGECSWHRRQRLALTWFGVVAILTCPAMIALTVSLKVGVPRYLVLPGPLSVLIGLLCVAIASGLLPRAKHIDERKTIFAGCGRKWLEQFPKTS